MSFGVSNPEKIWHQQFVHLPTSPVYRGHLTFGNPKVFSTVLFIHTSDYSRYLRRKQTVTPYLPHLKNITALPCKMQNLFIWLKVMLHSSKPWWLWKEPVVMCGNWDVKQATSQQVFKVTTFCTDTCFHFIATDQLHCPPRSAENQPMSEQDASATHPYRRLVLDRRALAACPDAVVYRVELRTDVGWPHVRTDELGCLTVQKLNCHEHNVLTHCLAGRQTRLQQCCGSLVAVSASATRLDNTARWFLLHAGSTKMRSVQLSLDTARAHVSNTNPRYGRVAEASCCDMSWISAQRGGT